MPSIFTRTPSSPAPIRGLTNGQTYRTVGRAYKLLNPALGDVDGNRLYGPDTAVSTDFIPNAINTITTYTDATPYSDTTLYAS
jgi:hypothetical protein